MLNLTDEEKATQARNLATSIHKLVVTDLEATLLINKKEPLSQEYFDFFNTSSVVHPELDVETNDKFNEVYEKHIRKL
jgi:hypothetical protein